MDNFAEGGPSENKQQRFSQTRSRTIRTSMKMSVTPGGKSSSGGVADFVHFTRRHSTQSFGKKDEFNSTKTIYPISLDKIEENEEEIN